MLDAAAAPRIHVPGLTEFTGGWQATASLAAVLEPADRARLGESMTAVVTDTDEPGWNRQQALAALAAVGRHLSDAARDRLFPTALLAARGSLDNADDDQTLPSGQLNRSRISLGDATLGFDGILASAALASTPDQYQSVINLAYELIPQARPHQANRIAQALALLPVAGRALLDPRALAAHEGEWIRCLAAVVWATAHAQPPDVGHRLAADPSGNVRRSLAAQLPDNSQHENLRAKLRHDVRRSVCTALKTAD